MRRGSPRPTAAGESPAFPIFPQPILWLRSAMQFLQESLSGFELCQHGRGIDGRFDHELFSFFFWQLLQTLQGVTLGAQVSFNADFLQSGLRVFQGSFIWRQGAHRSPPLFGDSKRGRAQYPPLHLHSTADLRSPASAARPRFLRRMPYLAIEKGPMSIRPRPPRYCPRRST